MVVHFNRSVKVLGYYLSDEERELKQHWSAENYERMVALKRALKRQKLVQMKQQARTDAAQLQQKECGPLKSLELLIDMPAEASHNLHNSTFSNDSNNNNNNNNNNKDINLTCLAWGSKQRNANHVPHLADAEEGEEVVEEEEEEEEEQKEASPSSSPSSSPSPSPSPSPSQAISRPRARTLSAERRAHAGPSHQTSFSCSSPFSHAHAIAAEPSAGAAEAAIAPAPVQIFPSRSSCVGRPRTMEVRLRPVQTSTATATQDRDLPFDTNVSDCEQWSAYILGVLVEGSCLAVETVRALERKINAATYQPLAPSSSSSSSSSAATSSSDDWMDMSVLSCLSNTFR